MVRCAACTKFKKLLQGVLLDLILAFRHPSNWYPALIHLPSLSKRQLRYPGSQHTYHIELSQVFCYTTYGTLAS